MGPRITTARNVAGLTSRKNGNTFYKKLLVQATYICFSLNDHVRNCHKAEDQLCTLCDKGFKSRKALVAHYMRSHGDDDGEKKSSAKREHPCPVCGRICVTKQTLEQHVLQHGPKNVTCEVCGKAYASEKRFICSQINCLLFLIYLLFLQIENTHSVRTQ